MSEFTPGPWTVSQQQGLRLFIVGNDEALAETLSMAWDDEQFANARLIAAAPDLLAELENIAETLDKMAPCPEEILDQLLASAQSAIRKAKGVTRQTKEEVA